MNPTTTLPTHLTLLFEIGTEELPSSFVDAALAALPALISTKLATLRLSHGTIRALGTPRRLALLVEAVASVQPDLDEEVYGPPESAAYKDGAPTKAAEAFANKLGIAVTALRIADVVANGKQKAGRFVAGRRAEKGKAATDLLGNVLSDLIREIPFRKSMRWGHGDETFGRPVQWLVALFGDTVVDVRFAGIASGRSSYGHRFLSPARFDLATADDYIEDLRTRHVLVDREERANTMMDRVKKAANDLGGVHDPELSLVDENASLVEEPHVVTGTFDASFLSLPPSVIQAVARGHQKYFTVRKREGSEELLPNYLTVANTANSPTKVQRGNDRVMRARLSDARFFFEEDKKAKLEERVEKLSGIVFQHKLGTVREKVARIERLVQHLTTRLGLPAAVTEQAVRAAHLCKFDLVSLMVGEFPELQGDMGRAYALFAGETVDVANAIRDHYKPIGAEGTVAESDVATVVALADRFDTLTGCFAIGLAPTGAADPFALRRACIALLRTLLEHGERSSAYAELSFSEVLGWAYDGLEGKKLELSREDAIKKIEDFARERLRGIVQSGTSNSVADAVMNDSSVEKPTYVVVRARALQRAVDEKAPWLDLARTVGKRLSGISKDATPSLHDKSVFSKDDDFAIVDLVAQMNRATAALISEEAVRYALSTTEDLAKRLDGIFANTLVNDPNDPKTRERLEVLSFGARCMLKIADFSRL